MAFVLVVRDDQLANQLLFCAVSGVPSHLQKQRVWGGVADVVAGGRGRGAGSVAGGEQAVQCGRQVVGRLGGLCVLWPRACDDL